MICHTCEAPARGVCKFCGRALCGDHQESLPYIVSVYLSEVPRAIVVADTLFCGVCRPQPGPVDMPELL